MQVCSVNVESREVYAGSLPTTGFETESLAEFVSVGTPAIFSDQCLSTSLLFASQTYTAVLSFCSMGDWDLDSGPHAWMMITLLAEPSSQPYSIPL